MFQENKDYSKNNTNIKIDFKIKYFVMYFTKNQILKISRFYDVFHKTSSLYKKRAMLFKVKVKHFEIITNEPLTNQNNAIAKYTEERDINM